MTTDQTACPPHDVLRCALIGSLSEKDCASIEQHLAMCPECLRAAETIEPRDTLLELFRSAAAIQASLVPHVAASHELIDRFQRLAPSLLEATRRRPTWRAVVRKPTHCAGASAIAPVKSDSDAAPLRPCLYEGSASYAFLAPAQDGDELGRLGTYRIVRVLGEGGMGIVFEAEDTQLKRRVALKVMKPAIAASVAARKRFVREAQTVAALDHDNVVTIHQVGEDRGALSWRCPFCKAKVWMNVCGEMANCRSTRCWDRPRNGRRAGRGAAHGLIHRDIKPGNIWLEAGRARPRVKILDFGLARPSKRTRT